MSWLPALVAEEIVGQNSIFTHDLKIFHLYIQSLSTSFGHSLVCRKFRNSIKASATDLPHSEIVQSSPKSTLLQDPPFVAS